MPNDTLQQVIDLINQKRTDDAQKLLEPLLITEPHNLTAWLWYVETISSNRERLKALELCLKHNPDNPQAKQLFDHFQSYDSESSPAYSEDEEAYQKRSQSILTGLSIISALAITSTWLMIPLVQSPEAPGWTTFYLTGFIITGQWVLVIPATLIVILVHSQILGQDQKRHMPTKKRFHIPLIYNLLAANSLFVFSVMLALLASLLQLAGFLIGQFIK
jgi:hypothetical protein